MGGSDGTWGHSRGNNLDLENVAHFNYHNFVVTFI